MNEDRRCIAHLSDGSGDRCKKSAMRYQNVCRSHGGGAAQCIAAGQRRMAALVPKAADRVERTITDETIDPAVRLRASFGVLDRVGIGEVSTVRVEQATEALADPGALVVRSLAIVLKALALGDAVAFLTAEERHALETIFTAVKGRMVADARVQEARRALVAAHEIKVIAPEKGYD